jgi:hypothetical protein
LSEQKKVVKIYFKTNMTEIPKTCMKYGNKGQSCHLYWACRACEEKVPTDCRPSWCPLRTSTEIAEAKEKEDE